LTTSYLIFLGEVDSAELGKMLKSLGMSLSEEELQQMFILLDLDGDGTVVRTH
jgi:Ca2+-binding EF-hand superfamily protein